MSRAWMPLYIADYLKDTRRLSAAQHGAYLLLLMDYWTTGALPNDDEQLARIACMPIAEWKKSRPLIQSFFYDGWKHKRVETEISKSSEVSSAYAKRAQQAANTRWDRHRTSNGSGNA